MRCWDFVLIPLTYVDIVLQKNVCSIEQEEDLSDDLEISDYENLLQISLEFKSDDEEDTKKEETGNQSVCTRVTQILFLKGMLRQVISFQDVKAMLQWMNKSLPLKGKNLWLSVIHR